MKFALEVVLTCSGKGFPYSKSLGIYSLLVFSNVSSIWHFNFSVMDHFFA